MAKSLKQSILGRETKQPCVYMFASKRNGTLHAGVTSNLVQRIWQHKNELVEGFTRREKAIKEWKRAWKLEFIQKGNPTWRDLYEEIVSLDSGFRRNDEIGIHN